jgi:hypothetical protein
VGKTTASQLANGSRECAPDDNLHSITVDPHIAALMRARLAALN